MAEILDQNAIDDLLNSSFDMDEETVVDSDIDVEKPKSKSRKVIKPENKPSLKFDFRYVSPIIKKESIILDPETAEKDLDDKPVVWTLQGYNMNRRKKLSSK